MGTSAPGVPLSSGRRGCLARGRTRSRTGSADPAFCLRFGVALEPFRYLAHKKTPPYGPIHSPTKCTWSSSFEREERLSLERAYTVKNGICRSRSTHRTTCVRESSLLLKSLELSDEPYILGTASHFCEAVVLGLRTVAYSVALSLREGVHGQERDLQVPQHPPHHLYPRIHCYLS